MEKLQTAIAEELERREEIRIKNDRKQAEAFKVSKGGDDKIDGGM